MIISSEVPSCTSPAVVLLLGNVTRKTEGTKNNRKQWGKLGIDSMQLWGLRALWLSALSGLLRAETLFVEGDNDPSKICKLPPHWEIAGQTPMESLRGKVAVASRLGNLRDKLARSGLMDVGFLVVNERTAMSRAMYWELKRRVAEGIPVYQQAALQDDVWEALQGDKDDFLVYDRCGRLTFHIVLPYSFLHYPFIEAAIRATYHKDICGNCSVNSNSTLSAQWNITQHNVTELPEVKKNVMDASITEGVPLPTSSDPRALEKPVGVPVDTPHNHHNHQGMPHPNHHHHHSDHGLHQDQGSQDHDHHSQHHDHHSQHQDHSGH
ncbi:hypothetical protein AGOR_G00242150 [Albula goreensis]|uniref:Selenoprotein P N-terminal domain-containing protein n=1 Tax=Albula goreensis TaxID=1534307 RepID=A0A8T3CDQ7_9TELE|nr:hypothetical protein AGOR_G00242150 [Albula goreensis]